MELIVRDEALAARSTSFSDARSMKPSRSGAAAPPRACSCSTMTALERYWSPVHHGAGRQATTVKTTMRRRASTLRLMARVMSVMGLALSPLDAGGGDGGGGGGDGGGGGSGDGDGEGGGGGGEGKGVTKGGEARAARAAARRQRWSGRTPR